nr:hypothetical protein [Ensifer sp. IC4062]
MITAKNQYYPIHRFPSFGLGSRIWVRARQSTCRSKP